MKSFIVRACLVLHWLALAIWLSAVIAPGVAAMSAFTTLPDPALGVSLEKFAAFEPGPASHGRLAAGQVLEPIFTFADLVQIVAAVVALSTMVILLALQRARWTRAANLIRIACVLIAVGMLTFRAVTMTPAMNRELRAYWSAAEAGEIEAALAHRDRFDSFHHRAETIYSVTLVLILVAIGTSAIALGSPPTPAPPPSPLSSRP